MQKAADWTLSLAIPLHMQITTNALVTDYVPTRFRGKATAALLAAPAAACVAASRPAPQEWCNILISISML